MKNLNITFEDADFKKLEKIREAQYPACKSWEEFILVITGAKELKDFLKKEHQ